MESWSPPSGDDEQPSTPSSNMTLNMKAIVTMKKFSPSCQKDRRTEGMQNKTADSERQTAALQERGGVSPPVRQTLSKLTLGLSLVVALFVQGMGDVMAQTNLSNTWSAYGTNPGTSGSNQAAAGTTGSNAGFLTQNATYWWGGTVTGNNVLNYLNSDSVNVQRLSPGQSPNVSWYTWSQNGSTLLWSSSTNSGAVNAGANASPTITTSVGSTTTPANSNNAYAYQDHIYTFTGTYDLGFAGTHTLTTDADPATVYGGTEHFQILGGIVNKQGTGTLSLQINKLEIVNFLGTAGTLELATHTSGPLPTGTLDSTTVNFNGGGAITGHNGQTSSAGFNVHSVNADNIWSVSASIGASNTTSGGGFNNTGYIELTGPATLNAVNNIGMGNFGAATTDGYLHVSTTMDLGTYGDTHVLNVYGNGELTVGGLFSAGTAADSTTYINDVWGGNFVTNAGTRLAAIAESIVFENISDSTRDNTGEYYVGEYGAGTLNIYSFGAGAHDLDDNNYGNPAFAGILNTTGGNVVFGVEDGSNGTGNIFGEDSELNLTGAYDLIAGQKDGAKGFINVFYGATLNVDQDVIIGQDGGSEGTAKVHHHGTANAGRDWIIAEHDGATGVVEVNHYGTINVERDMYTGKGDTGVGTDANGSLYAWDHATVNVGGNKTIAKEINSIGHEYYDGSGTTLTVGGTLTVGEYGYAGGVYTENRYDDRYVYGGEYEGIIGERDRFNFGDGHDPNDWLDEGMNFIGSNMKIGDANWDPKGDDPLTPIITEGLYTGNAPGLAIVRGAAVVSEEGILGKGRDIPTDTVSNGYVVIDNKDATLSDHGYIGRSVWVVGNWLNEDSDPVDANFLKLSDPADWDPTQWERTGGGSLTVGDEGVGFLRVLNGALLVTGEAHLSRGDDVSGYGGIGTVHVYGGGAEGYPSALAAGYTTEEINGVVHIYDPAGNLAYFVSGDGKYLLDKEGKYIADTSFTGYRTEWYNFGPLVIGEGKEDQDSDAVRDDDSISRGTVRINDGAYAQTNGLFVGVEEFTWGEVSVMGRASELHVFSFDTADPRYATLLAPPKGSGLFSASDYGFVHLHEGANVVISQKAVFSNGATLFLDAGKYDPITGEFLGMGDAPTFDTGLGSFNMTNARIVGVGTVGGEKGVLLTQDDTYTEGQAYIDPGLVLPYDPSQRCESPYYYGTLTFGDQLTMSGNVMTRFDINHLAGENRDATGYLDISSVQGQDLIVVQRVSPGTAPIFAKLDGTLTIHARCTDYYALDSSFTVVQTVGDLGTPGTILGKFSDFDIEPRRFFTMKDPEDEQQILTDSNGNQYLEVSMHRNDAPFSTAGYTYNLKETGKGLDMIYQAEIAKKENGEPHDEWLPVLQYFWYLGDPAFADSLHLFSGEVRAHSLRLPMPNVWQYAHNRLDGRLCDCCFDDNPCAPNVDSREDWELGCGTGSKFLKKCRKCFENTHFWGSVIWNKEDVNSDGNAFGYNIRREGVVVGADKMFRKGHLFGFMFAFNDSELDTYRAGAKADDFNFGLYHSKNFRDNRWEWKNYLGMGIQDYDMWRDMGLGLSEEFHYNLSPHEVPGHPQHGTFTDGMMVSKFRGYTFHASTEIARPFYFGKCAHWMIRPFLAVDVAGVWQNGAEETGHRDLDPEIAKLVALEFKPATDIRVYGRQGVTIRRDGPRGYLRGGVTHSYLMGGRPYSSVNNQFIFDREFTDTFNIRGVNEGNSIVSGNCGLGMWFGKKKTGTLWIDYTAYSGLRTTAYTLQVGAQKKF